MGSKTRHRRSRRIATNPGTCGLDFMVLPTTVSLALYIGRDEQCRSFTHLVDAGPFT
jgi:hypothetical protein